MTFGHSIGPIPRSEGDAPELTSARHQRDGPSGSLPIVDRITVNPKVMAGVPCIRGLRIPVATVVNMIACGMTPAEVVEELPPLELEDVAAALRFAADLAADREITLRPTA